MSRNLFKEMEVSRRVNFLLSHGFIEGDNQYTHNKYPSIIVTKLQVRTMNDKRWAALRNMTKQYLDLKKRS